MTAAELETWVLDNIPCSGVEWIHGGTVLLVHEMLDDVEHGPELLIPFGGEERCPECWTPRSLSGPPWWGLCDSPWHGDDG